LGPQRSTYPVNHSVKETAKRECKDLTEKIIGRGHRADNKMGFGFLESVYEKCLLIALRKDGARAQRHKPMIVCYEGEIVGPFVAGIGVEDTRILQLKSGAVVVAHEIQRVNYLAATGRPVGLVLDFGERKEEVKPKVRQFSER